MRKFYHGYHQLSLRETFSNTTCKPGASVNSVFTSITCLSPFTGRQWSFFLYATFSLQYKFLGQVFSTLDRCFPIHKRSPLFNEIISSTNFIEEKLHCRPTTTTTWKETVPMRHTHSVQSQPRRAKFSFQHNKNTVLLCNYHRSFVVKFLNKVVHQSLRQSVPHRCVLIWSYLFNFRITVSSTIKKNVAPILSFDTGSYQYVTIRLADKFCFGKGILVSRSRKHLSRNVKHTR